MEREALNAKLAAAKAAVPFPSETDRAVLTEAIVAAHKAGIGINRTESQHRLDLDRATVSQLQSSLYSLQLVEHMATEYDAQLKREGFERPSGYPEE